MTALAGSVSWTRPALRAGSATSRSFCMMDGRLDNRADLVAMIGDEARNGLTDAALVLALYERSGIAALERLIGDWSLVIWDHHQETLVLASDYAGCRPLYFHTTANRVVWNSSCAAIIRQVPQLRWSEDYVADFLFDGTARDTTPYRDVLPVPAGKAVEISRVGKRIIPLWHPPLDRTILYKTEHEYAEHLLSLFRTSVGSRLHGTKVWAELSGGLDSSSVACMARELLEPGRLGAISYVTEGSTDAPYIAAVEHRCGVTSVKLNDLAYPFIQPDLSRLELPYWWQARYEATRQLMEKAGSQVLLTGQLGDLVMSNWYDDSEQAADYFYRGSVVAGFAEAFHWSRMLGMPIYSVVWRAFEQASLRSNGSLIRDLENGSKFGTSLSTHMQKRAVDRAASRKPRQEWNGLPPTRRKRAVAMQEMLGSRRLQCPPPLMGMQVAHPFADQRLVEFMLRIPASVTCRPGEPRKLMRKSFSDLLPPDVVQRRNKASYRQSCMQSLEPLARNLLQPGAGLAIVDLGYVDPDSLRSRVSRMLNGLESNETQLRQIILLEYWLQSRDAAHGDLPLTSLTSQTEQCPA